MPIRFLDSDTDGEPGQMIDPVPAGTPGMWLALDRDAQLAVIFLIQCAEMVSGVRDRHKTMPLAFVSSIDGLRIALRGIQPVKAALDQPRPHHELTDEHFDEPLPG